MAILLNLVKYIIKDKNKRVNDKNNHRPICLSTVCSKIIEVVIFNRISNFLESTSNQFGFKPKHGTELCICVQRVITLKNMVLPCTSPFWMPRRPLVRLTANAKHRRTWKSGTYEMV